MRGITLFFCLTLATACDEHITGPTVPLDSAFTLAPGETATVTDASARVRFNGVESDSRCPADALCVQGGDAVVRITVVNESSSRDHELHTGDMQPVQDGDLTIALEQLSPYPFSSRTIDPGEYRATLRVTR